MTKTENSNLSDKLSLNGGIRKARGLLRRETGLVYTTIGNMGASVLGGLFWFVLAGLLSVDSYGVVNYYIALANVFFAVGLVGLDSTLITFLAKGEKAIHYQVTSFTFISAIVIASILSVIEWSSGVLAATMIFFMMALAETLGGKMYRHYAFLLIGQRVAQIIFSIILYFPLGILGILLGYLLGNLLFSVRYMIRALPNFTLRFTEIREKRNFALHSYGTNLIRNFTLYLDKLIIAPLFGYYLLGLYQLAFQFFMFLNIIPLSLYSYLLPEEASGKDKRTVKLLGLLVSVVAAVAAFVGLPYVIERFFFAFVDSIPIVRIMGLAIIPATIIAILNATLLGRGCSKTVFTAGLAYIVSLVIGIAVLGQALGAVGLAVTLLASQIIQATCLVLRRRDSSKTTPTKQNPQL